jgi:hypothetical protein
VLQLTNTSVETKLAGVKNLAMPSLYDDNQANGLSVRHVDNRPITDEQKS